MNREIKFRVWDRNECKMKVVKEMNLKEVNLINDLFPLMQYTNCYDINSKEIYEGDIVESQRGQNVYIGEVVWFDVGWYIHTELTNIKKDGSKYKYPDYIRLKPRYGTCINKVIGNIFENKELLKL